MSINVMWNARLASYTTFLKFVFLGDVKKVSSSSNLQSANYLQLEAIGCNCFNPKFMQGIVKTIKNCIETNSKMIGSSNNSIRPRIVVYPNSGEYFDSRQGHRSWHTYDGEEMKVLQGEDAKEFYSFGCEVIGGCCRVNHDQIALFANEFLK